MSNHITPRAVPEKKSLKQKILSRSRVESKSAIMWEDGECETKACIVLGLIAAPYIGGSMAAYLSPGTLRSTALPRHRPLAPGAWPRSYRLSYCPQHPVTHEAWPRSSGECLYHIFTLNSFDHVQTMDGIKKKIRLWNSWIREMRAGGLSNMQRLGGCPWRNGLRP